MCTSTKFFRCKHCGNIIGTVFFSGVTPVCCGDEMQELVPNTVDAAQEKHVPVYEINGSKLTVKVGSVEHPMVNEHYIQWIYVRTQNGGQRVCLNPGEAPMAVFDISEGEPVEVYEYCNLHGLWKAEIK